MTYSTFADEYTRMSCWDPVSHEARWHYHAMVEENSRSKRYDGWLPLTLALRVSDVPDPARCLDELAATPLLEVADNAVRIVHMESFLPPEGQRDENLLPRKRQNQAAYRQRICESGVHGKDCPPATCPVKLAARDDTTTALPGALPPALPVTHQGEGGHAEAEHPGEDDGRNTSNGVTACVTGNAWTGLDWT